MESDLEGITGDDPTRPQQRPSYGIDKAIENHWNSGKRKLDMYSPSELLSQFQDLSLVNHHHHSAASSYTKSQKINETSGPTQVPPMRQWTAEEQVKILRKAVQRYKQEFMENEGFQRLHRRKKHRKPNHARAQQSKEENEVIFKLVNKYGHQRWSDVTKHLPPRHGNQGRERRRNRLNPDIKTPWTHEEELALIRAYLIHGDKWGELTKLLPGRSAHAIKNYWNNSVVKKKTDSYLASAGILSKFQDLSLLSSVTSST